MVEPFHLIQTIYWLALSTWFGGVLFVAIAAPIVFRTIRENNPVLPHVLSVNLEGQHGTLLAGSIVGSLLRTMFKVQVICASALLLTMIAQWFYIRRDGTALVLPILRAAMFLASVVLLLYDWRVVWPKVWRHRQEYIDHADEPEIANPAKEQFDRFHQESVTVLRNILFLLLGLVLFSAMIQRANVLTSISGR